MTTATEPQTDHPTRRTRWLRRAIVAVVTLVVIGGACVGYWWAELQVYHPLTIQKDVLYRDGNRDLREFRHTLRDANIRTDISLIDDDELNDPKKPQFKQEAEYCKAKGIQLVRIPVKLGGWPTSDQIKQFLGIVADPANRPVLIHCAQGVRRTGMFMAAYQLSVKDQSVPYVKGTIQAFGHKSQDLDDVRTFIDAYDPATATVPPNLKSKSAE
jgi:protein tyrosine phosphatase (PTP) superfamily phosphohydrolase (DUF442 family)